MISSRLRCYALSLSAATALVAGRSGSPPSLLATVKASLNEGLWQCYGHLLPDFNMAPADAGGTQEGISYLYIGSRELNSDYLAAATFTLPRTNLQHGWYANSIVLKPRADNRVFVSLMLMRNKRFNFAEHIAVAWALPRAADVSYKDTNLIYPNPGGPHRLSIGVKHNRLSLHVDGQNICTTQTERFFRPRAIKFFQVRTETNAPGYHSSGTVYQIELKRDRDASPMPYLIRCEWHGSGVSWSQLSDGSFRTIGAFDAKEATYIDGAKPHTKCAGVVR